MTPALVAENGVHLFAHLFEQAVAQQAVLPAAGQHAKTVGVGQPGRPVPVVSRETGVDELQYRVRIGLALFRLQVGDRTGKELVGQQEFVDVDLAGGVFQHVLQKAVVDPVIKSVESDRPAK